MLQDPVLAPKWKALTGHVTERQARRQALDREFTEKVEDALERTLGSTWVEGNGFGTPQPARWYNSEVFWNWFQSRRALDTFTDQQSNVSYGRADIPNETRYNVVSGGITLVSSNQAGARAELVGRVYSEMQTDEQLRQDRDAVERMDRDLASEVEGIRISAVEFYERTVESKKLVGNCPVCP